MKTSPTDRLRLRRRRRARRAGQGGFTLVELMVVLVILGLASSAVVLAFPDPQGSLVAEAERFAARAKAARDEALLTGRATAVQVDGEGYAISRRAGGEWQQAASHEWARGTQAVLGAGAEGRAVFDPTGLADPLHLGLARGGRQVVVEIGADGDARVRR
jgi:general secretion pathway protein H